MLNSISHQTIQQGFRILIVAAVFAILCVNTGCSVGSDVQRLDQATTGSLLSSSFESLWWRNTILLGPRARGEAGFLPQNGGPFSAFPLVVRTTLIDSQLVEEGIREFGILAGMDANRMEQYRNVYRQMHWVDGYFFLDVEMSTNSTEEFLDVDRWIFYLEDEKRTQVEPIRIVEHSIQKEPPQIFVTNDPGGFPLFSTLSRRIELYFQSDRFPENTNELKFVILDKQDFNTRAEGKWNRAAVN